MEECENSGEAESVEGERRTDPATEAWNLALRKISRMDRTSQEIRLFLAKSGFESSVVENTIRRMFEYAFLDDGRYAAAFTRLQGQRGKGPAVIRMKLKQKGLVLSDAEIVRIVEEAQGRDDLARAIEIIERRYPGFRDDRAVGKKAYEALVRRGFSFELARRAILSPVAEDGESNA
ncbi:MAG: RecX family transcriptional regulator [Bdellovibrionales bacterium]|nr:RecX family transcriptional regulator [Bdellovibrionales bacterium]